MYDKRSGLCLLLGTALSVVVTVERCFTVVTKPFSAKPANTQLASHQDQDSISA